MKGLIRMIIEDYRQEGFTRDEWMVYGLIGPVALIVVLLAAEWLETTV